MYKSHNPPKKLIFLGGGGVYNGIVHYKIGDFMRRIRRKKEKQKKKIIIISTFLFLIIMTSGYAAFSTNITLRAKGNIKERPQDESCFTYYDNGDGTLTVSGYDVEKCGTDVNIPEKNKWIICY